MGQHFVPQHYLRQFATKDNPNRIWMYDKCNGQFKRLPIKNVAQASGFYFEEDETALNEQVEGPAIQPLEKLRNGKAVSQEERRLVAQYLQSQLSRVPKARNDNLDRLKREYQNMMRQVEERLQSFIKNPNSPPERVRELVRELERWKQYKLDDIPPDFTQELVQRQLPLPGVVEQLYVMTWRIMRSDAPDYFLTSDNPVHFFRWMGLLHQDVEVSVPLSSSVSLHASYRGTPMDTLFVRATPSLVKEINRRTVHGADRFLFFHQDADWVGNLAEKLHLSMNPLVWKTR